MIFIIAYIIWASTYGYSGVVVCACKECELVQAQTNRSSSYINVEEEGGSKHTSTNALLKVSQVSINWISARPGWHCVLLGTARVARLVPEPARMGLLYVQCLVVLNDNIL